MNAPKVPTVKAPKSPIGGMQQGTQGMAGQAGGPLKENPELVLKPSKTNPAVKRWQRAYEEPEKEDEAKAKAEEKQIKQPRRPDFKVGDRIAFQTKAQFGSIDFTFGKITSESDNYFGVHGDDGETYSLLKQQAHPINEAHRVIEAEQRQAKREGREPRTAEGMRSREVKIRAGESYQPGILTEKGELWQAVNVGNYVDYVKLGVLNENALVGLKIGEMLGVTTQEGENDIIHRSDVVRVGQGVNSQAVEKYMKRMESHLDRLEKRIQELQLDNKSLREFVKKKAEDKGISSKEQERLNKEIVRYKQKAQALQEKINTMTLKRAEEERKRLEALSLTKKEKEEKKTRLEQQKEKLEKEIEKLKATETEKRSDLEKQLTDAKDQIKFLEESRRQAKKEVATFQEDVAKYRKELEGVNQEIDNLKRRDYDLALEHIRTAGKKKTKYDFSGIDFDSIDFQHVMDVMYGNLPENLAQWRKKECWDLIKNNKGAFFDRMLNYAKKHYQNDDDLTSLQKMYGSNWMMEGTLDEHTLSRVKTIDEGDISMYDQYGPSDEEIERQLESKNRMMFEKTLKDLKIDEKELSSLKKGDPLYEEFLEGLVKNIMAEGATRAEVYQEMAGKEMEQPVEELPPEALYDPLEPWTPTELDWGSVDWHEDNYHESFQHLSDEEKRIYNSLPRDDENRLMIEPESYYEDLTEDEAKEVQGILNTLYAEDNYHLTHDRVKQDMSELLATAEIITDRAKAKASEKVKDTKELEKMQEQVSAKEKEFLEKYLYGRKIEKAYTVIRLFGQMYLIRKSQLGMFGDLPISVPKKARTVVTRQPLHHLEHSDKALLPSKKNPRVRRWQTVGEEKEGTMGLFGEAKVESEKLKGKSETGNLKEIRIQAIKNLRERKHKREFSETEIEFEMEQIMSEREADTRAKAISKEFKEREEYQKNYWDKVRKLKEKYKNRSAQIDSIRQGDIAQILKDIEKNKLEVSEALKLLEDIYKNGLIAKLNYEIYSERLKGKSEKGKEPSDENMKYAKRIRENLKYMDSSASEWFMVPVKRMVEVESGGGKTKMMPEFDMSIADPEKGYKQAPSLYKNTNVASGESFNCEWCGHIIKNAFWIYNPSKKWYMCVGSECITTFHEEGKTGQQVAKEQINKINRELFESLLPIYDRIKKEHQEEKWVGKRKVHSEWTNPFAPDIISKIIKIYGKIINKVIISKETGKVMSDYEKIKNASDRQISNWIKENAKKVLELKDSIERNRLLTKPDDKKLIESLSEFDKRVEGESSVEKSIFKSYKLDKKYTFQGLPISIENKKGSKRSGADQDGHNWETLMKVDYGYIRLTEGVDGDHLDCFVGPDKKAEFAYVIHQNDPVTGVYDEDKAMLGFSSAEQARECFLDHYDRPGFYGSMTVLPMDQFKKRILKKKKPVVFDPKDTKKSVILFGRRYMIKSSIVKFCGETNYDAIINHFGLDIVEEQEFLDYMKNFNLDKNSNLDELKKIYDEWIKQKKAA